MQRAHLFGTESQTAQPIRKLPAQKGREERDGRGRSKDVGGGWLVAGSGERERETERKTGRERVGEREGGETGTVCGAGRRHVISQIDKFQSSAKAKSRGY